MAPAKQHSPDQAGFSLVELLIATVVAVVGVVAVVLLIMYGIRLQAFSRDATMASGLAKAKIEQLRVTPPTAPDRQPGGSLTNDVGVYYDPFPMPPDWNPGDAIPLGTILIRRWRIDVDAAGNPAPGPAGTQDVTVAVVPSNPTVLLPPVQMRVLLEP